MLEMFPEKLVHIMSEFIPLPDHRNRLNIQVAPMLNLAMTLIDYLSHRVTSIHKHTLPKITVARNGFRNLFSYEIVS